MNATSPADTPRRLAVLAAAGVAALATAAVALPGRQAEAAADKGPQHPGKGAKPTVVLEHGAFADASSWDGVVERLQREGYPVVAAANPLRGPASDAAHLRGVLDNIGGPVVLVGHSYGGTVISQAAAGREDQVRALVYIAAFLPDTGETSLELSDKFPGSTLGDVLDPAPHTLPDGQQGTDLYIRQDRFRQQFAADVPAGKARLMAAGQRPIAAAALEEKSTEAAWKTIPSWSLIATQDRNIPPAAQRFMSERAGSRTVEVEGASHAVSVSRPDAVTRVITDAATRTR
ncbi:alpha/beta hydrolase [Streptomyces carminius]|uniref:Alpha/beta hydrolase n=1 Tax=Streptomyces carminius TaxID=2665496 RepID=A0A2M8LPT7_9ACTN|nr:alpha/beta hydrolase [Streptomyces carminius]PJE93967.1 alpha/beta hydrolase [Streptomyces carminius]